MNFEFLANPPLPLGQGSHKGVFEELLRIAKTFSRIIWQAFIPFNPRPEPPRDPPEAADEIDDGQLALCEKIFNNVEASRIFLEGKARATFTLVSFLTPLLISIFVVALSKTTPGPPARTIAIIFATVSTVFLLLGFISIVRAVSVQVREELSLGAVIDFEKRKFRKYRKHFYARGLLYCASVNQAMNDHIAQFVKGAHILTAAAVIAVVIAAVPAAVVVSSGPSLPIKAELLGSVNLSSSQFVAILDEITKLRNEIAVLAKDKSAADSLLEMEGRVTQIETRIRELEATMAAGGNVRK